MRDIFWMVESIPAILQDGQDVDIRRYLSPDEIQTLNGLTIEKRRREWLAGRIAVKQLYTTLNETGGGKSSYSVEREPSGAPYLTRNGSRISGMISISHSHGLAAVCYAPDYMRIGIDIEEVTNRDGAFLSDYFTDQEKAWVLSGESGNPNLQLNLIWSAKESILKCLASGLGTDPLRVEIKRSSVGHQSNSWQQLQGRSHTALGLQDWQLSWRTWQDSVLTLCFPPEIQGKLHEVLFSGIR